MCSCAVSMDDCVSLFFFLVVVVLAPINVHPSVPSTGVGTGRAPGRNEAHVYTTRPPTQIKENQHELFIGWVLRGQRQLVTATV